MKSIVNNRTYKSLLLVLCMLFIPMLLRAASGSSSTRGSRHSFKVNAHSNPVNDIENKAVLLFSPKSQAKASLYIELVDAQEKTIRIDWGEGNGVEKVTLDENGYINHTFSKDVDGYHIVIIDVSNVEILKDGDYDGAPIGVREINAPKMIAFSTCPDRYS